MEIKPVQKGRFDHTRQGMRVRRRAPAAWLLLAGTFLLGCGDDTHSLVGRWRLLASNDGHVVQELIFREDLTFVMRNLDEPDAPARLGTYSVRGSLVTLEEPPANEVDESQRWQVPFYTNGAQLLLPAFRPVGSHDGITGTWQGSFTFEVLTRAGERLQLIETLDYTFGANRSVSQVWTHPQTGEQGIKSGFYTIYGSTFLLTFIVSETQREIVAMELLDDSALGYGVYQH